MGGRLRILVALLSIVIAVACILESTKKNDVRDPERVARPF